MVEITYTIKKDFTKLDSIRRKIDRIIPLLEPLVKRFFSETVYITRGAEIGPTWKKRKKRKGGYSWPILEKSGDMKKNTKSKKTTTVLTIFNDTEYAKYHQYGTSKMVARPIFGTGEKLDQTIKNTLNTIFR